MLVAKVQSAFALENVQPENVNVLKIIQNVIHSAMRATIDVSINKQQDWTQPGSLDRELCPKS